MENENLSVSIEKTPIFVFHRQTLIEHKSLKRLRYYVKYLQSYQRQISLISICFVYPARFRKHTGYTVQSSNDPSFRKSLAPKHENGGLECPSSLTESTAQASCLAVMRFGDYHSNGENTPFVS